MKLKEGFPYLITVSLAGLAGFFHSAPFAYAAVLALVVTSGQEMMQQYVQAKTFKSTLPEETKKQIYDISARLTSLEMGVKQRGF